MVRSRVSPEAVRRRERRRKNVIMGRFLRDMGYLSVK